MRCTDKMKKHAMGWLSLCLLILLSPPVTPSGGVIFETLCSSTVGRAALTARALSRECVKVYCPRPLRKAMGWCARVPFGHFFALLVKRGTQRSSSFEEAESVQTEPIISYDRFMTSGRLRSKGAVNELGAGRTTVKSFPRKPLDKYRRLSMAFRKRHGLGLSMDEKEEEPEALLMNWENEDDEFESNDEADDYEGDSEVWWEEQIRQKGGRKKVSTRFPIGLGSVLKRRKWIKPTSSLSDDDSDLESEDEEEEDEDEAQDESMENSFDDSSDDDLESEDEEESEKRITRDEDSTSTVLPSSTYPQEYKYKNEEGGKGIEYDVLPQYDDDPLYDEDEWGSSFEAPGDVHYGNFDENEEWGEDHHHQCDFENQQAWSDDDDNNYEVPVITSVTQQTVEQQWGCKDPSECCVVHQYGAGSIHDDQPRNEDFRKMFSNNGKFHQENEEVVTSEDDENDWMFGNSLEDNESEENFGVVEYDESEEEERSRDYYDYNSEDSSEYHNPVGPFSYLHEEEEEEEEEGM